MLKVVEKKLQVSRNKVSRRWAKYRGIKAKVQKRKDLSTEEKRQILQSERETVYNNIKEVYTDYRDYKFSRVYKSPYKDFMFSKKVKTANTIQKYYKAKRGYNTDNLDKIIPDVLNEKGVTGVLVVFRVESEETGQYSYVSNYITKNLLSRLDDDSIFDYVANRLQAGNTKDYMLKFIYIRVIYEKSKM